MAEQGRKCYYDNVLCDYTCGFWQCQTCKEWFCIIHLHVAELGYCTECVACERERTNPK